jgi:hypothetical protein
MATRWDLAEKAWSNSSGQRLLQAHGGITYAPMSSA